MSQTELAKRLGLDKSSMSKIENGTRKVSSAELEEIANTFGVSADYLLGLKSNNGQQNLPIDLDEAIDNAMSFDGQPVTDHDRKVMKNLWRAYLSSKEQ